jgi:hypothetical protein
VNLNIRTRTAEHQHMGAPQHGADHYIPLHAC